MDRHDIEYKVRNAKEYNEKRKIMTEKIESYLKLCNKSLSELTENMQNKLINELVQDVEEHNIKPVMSSGKGRIQSLDIKDNVATYIKKFDTEFDRIMILKIINENGVKDEMLAYPHDTPNRARVRYLQDCIVEIINVDKDKNEITVKLTKKWSSAPTYF